MIELEDKIENSQYFRWREALWLPKWEVYAHPEDSLVASGIIKVSHKMDLIRAFFNRPIEVHSWYRPPKYNELIGGAAMSAHMSGLAVDFFVHDMESPDVRDVLIHKLEEFDIRMENMETPHVHIDVRCQPGWTNDQRYFKP